MQSQTKCRIVLHRTLKGHSRLAEKINFSRYVDTKGHELDWHQCVQGRVLLAELSMTVIILLF